MSEIEYLKQRVFILETLLSRALPVLRLAALYPTLVRSVELALEKPNVSSTDNAKDN